MRSGPTAPDSYSSRQEPGRKSFLSVTDDAGRSRLSATESEDPRKSSALSAPAVTGQRDVDYGVPGTLPAEPDRQKRRDRDKSAGCTLQ
ncbi:hypothetical protein SERLADRAFT_395522 [Serpula lacrymans var. lacrymans S7.9]|uniref:Uncharacterized protein n=1 Tax=Serpula lacrymans var. lacrymans (strain S7.9) TaxID=578457 RepID=F8P2K1_SERL9|nr:uncharacterized protein SERLADRAFT_395522 [Serpula lacrymans var. lacrymans S7.9]EGO22386.1 hypothetical protein SERLADRAFT_395522 [Serpula lacrymans var. lacrymans S7.9]